MLLDKKLFLLSILTIVSSSVYAVKTLKERAAQVYFATRSLSHIKADLENNKLCQELQEVLVPLVIKKYKKQLDARFIKVLKGHTDTITAVAISSDDRYALTGSRDNTARLWDLNTGKTIHVLQGHSNKINSVAFSADNRFALTGSWDGTARLWDLKTGQTIKVFDGPGAWGIVTVAFSQDSSCALTISGGNTACIWNLTTGDIVHSIEGPHVGPRGIDSATLSKSGRYALTPSSNQERKAYLWDIFTGKIVKELGPIRFGVGSSALSTDGRYALTGSSFTAYLWNCQIVSTGSGAVMGVLSSDGRYALTNSCDTEVSLWDLTIGQTIAVLDAYDYNLLPKVITMSPDDRYALIGGFDSDSYKGRACLWDLRYVTNNIELKELIDTINPFTLEAPCAIL